MLRVNYCQILNVVILCLMFVFVFFDRSSRHRDAECVRRWATGHICTPHGDSFVPLFSISYSLAIVYIIVTFNLHSHCLGDLPLKCLTPNAEHSSSVCHLCSHITIWIDKYLTSIAAHFQPAGCNVIIMILIFCKINGEGELRGQPANQVYLENGY